MEVKGAVRMENPGYYAIIPANVRYDTDLKANEKLLYGEISALSNKYGYCNASNKYFAKLFTKHKDTISNWISNLSSKNYIKTEIIKNSLGRVSERRIYLSAKMPIPCRQKHLYPIGENTEDNNTSNNIKEKEEEIKKVIQFYENNITLITPIVAEEISSYIDEEISSEVIIACMKESVDLNKRNWKYIKAIINDCIKNNIQTEKQFKIKQNEFKQIKNTVTTSQQKKEVLYNTDFSEYDKYMKKEEKKC